MTEMTYRLVDVGRGIQCLLCGTTPYNPLDVQQYYCGFCCRFHDDADAAEELRQAVGKLAGD